MNVWVVHRDGSLVRECCEQIVAMGHDCKGVEELPESTDPGTPLPDLLVVELDQLDSDIAAPEDLPGWPRDLPIVLVGPVPPDERVRSLASRRRILGYHDVSLGSRNLRLWIRAAEGLIGAGTGGGGDRAAIRRVLDAIPELHTLQSLDDVMEAILLQSRHLLGGRPGFVAARMSDPVGKPPIEGFTETDERLDDYVVTATTDGDFPRGETVDRLESPERDTLARAIDLRQPVLGSGTAILPLALADHVLGLAYLNRPERPGVDPEALTVFSTHAAAAIRSAALYDLATRDSTTRAFRKAFTLERLRETLKLAWRKEFPVTVLMLDIDSFKGLNDAYGHVVGDRALRHLANLLKNHVRDSDIVGRFGGDEFLVILIDANHDGADIVADRLYRALVSDRGHPWPGGVPPVSTSMGLVTLEPGEDGYRDRGFPDFLAVADAIIEAADTAMYEGRRKGKGMFAAPTLTWSDFAPGAAR